MYEMSLLAPSSCLEQRGHVRDIGVQCHNAKPMILGVLPDFTIGGPIQPKMSDVRGFRKQIAERVAQFMTQVLIEQEFHP
jgi:hypothetical protein